MSTLTYHLIVVPENRVLFCNLIFSIGVSGVSRPTFSFWQPRQPPGVRGLKGPQIVEKKVLLGNFCFKSKRGKRDPMAVFFCNITGIVSHDTNTSHNYEPDYEPSQNRPKPTMSGTTVGIVGSNDPDLLDDRKSNIGWNKIFFLNKRFKQRV